MNAGLSPQNFGNKVLSLTYAMIDLSSENFQTFFRRIDVGIKLKPRRNCKASDFGILWCPIRRKVPDENRLDRFTVYPLRLRDSLCVVQWYQRADPKRSDSDILKSSSRGYLDL